MSKPLLPQQDSSAVAYLDLVHPARSSVLRQPLVPGRKSSCHVLCLFVPFNARKEKTPFPSGAPRMGLTVAQFLADPAQARMPWRFGLLGENMNAEAALLEH